MRNARKRQQLIGDLKTFLHSAECPGNGRLPREIVLAERFQVSRETLRAALSALEEEQLIERIHGKGTFCCPGSGTSSLRVIYFLLPCAGFTDLIAGQNARLLRVMLGEMMSCAASHNCRVVTVPFSRTNNPDDIDGQTLQLIEPGSPVFLTSCWYREAFEWFHRRNCRVTLVHAPDYSIFWAPDEPLKPFMADWLRLRLDTGHCTRLATQELLKRGRRRPALFAGYLTDPTNRVLEGYQDVVAEAGIEAYWSDFVPGVEPRQIWQQLHQFQQKTGFDSLVLELPHNWQPDYRFSLQRNIGLPESVAIVTLQRYECNHLLQPPIPSMCYDYPDICRRAVHWLLDRTLPPDSITMRAAWNSGDDL